MLLLQNKIILMLCAIIISSCGFIDFRLIGIKIEPEKPDFVLPGKYSPVIIKFDTAMIKNDTEVVLQITSDYGAVSGDKIWKGNDLHFIPVNGWSAGVRYTLSLLGTIRSADKREARVEYFNTFYAVNKNDPPLLDHYSPYSGASLGINDVVLEFRFSRSMNKLSVESAFTLDGVNNKTFNWSDDDKNLRVTPEKELSAWVLYNWSVKDSAESLDGVSLPKIYSGFFTTDIDQTLPVVTRIYPVLNADGIWYPTGLNIETGLGLGQGIAVEFNKPMSENSLRSLRFEPSLSGKAEYLSDKSIVYIFSRAPDPQIEYTMIISGDTRDGEGLKLGEDLKINFIPDIPYLKILSLKNDSSDANIMFSENGAFKIQIDQGAGNFNLLIHFSLMFDFKEKQNAPQRITLAPFFPRTLEPVAVQYVNWISDDRLFLRWEGLKASNEEPHYYKLTIPGGKSGIVSEEGVYMKDDLVFYLEAAK